MSEKCGCRIKTWWMAGAQYDYIEHCPRHSEAMAQERDRLLAACRKLIDAPHYDHFAARMSDGEMEGIDAIKACLATPPAKTEGQ